jgi:TPR repeat protein
MKRLGVSGSVQGALWLVTGALGCAGPRSVAKAPSVAVPAAVVAAPLRLAPEPSLPQLTAPPAATPELSYRLDLRRLTRGITQGTNVNFDAESIIGVGAFPGASAERPILFTGALDLQRFVMAWPASSTVTLGKEKLDPALSGQGWASLAGGACALKNKAKSGPVVACGSAEALFAFGDSIDLSQPSLPSDHAIELDFETQSSLAAYGLRDLRESVPRRVDDFLDPPELRTSVPLRLALGDLGFDLAARLLEASQDLGRLRIAVSFDAQGAGHYEARLAPASDSAIGQAILGAHAVSAPKSLLKLPYDTSSAVFVDSSLLLPFLTPGRRALSLLAEARAGAGAGAVVLALSATFGACLVPNRTLVWAAGELVPTKEAPEKRASARAADKKQADKKQADKKQASDSKLYAVLELDDPAGTCAGSLSALSKAYSASADPDKKPEDRRFELLKPGAGVPQVTWVARFGTGATAAYAALSNNQGTTQIISANSLPTLTAALAALKGAVASRHTLAERADLSALAKQPALLGGFVPENTLTQSAWVAPWRGDPAVRVPFSFNGDGSTLTLLGTFQPETIRHVGAEILERMWEHKEWSALEPGQRSALVRVLDSACRLGSGGACNSLGVRYGDGIDLAKDVDRARELLTLGCGRGHGMSCVNLGFYGASPSEQLATFKKACELESAYGCAWYGAKLLQSKKPEEHSEAIPKLELACQGSSGFGCSELGFAYLKGTGVAEDDEKAADYELRSCRLGFGSGCASLGNAYANGIGRQKNEASALDAYKAACKLDKQNGCYALGIAYLRGVGAPKDPTAARAQLTLACDAGHADACRVLAEMTEAP